ncbi:MAG: family 43 glycosylhydrolase [Actinomycetota bacterium]
MWLIILVFGLGTSAQTYNNPVIPGDFPDPSVIRVGEDFYATATTGGWSPQFPILHSKDLVNWKIIGAVFNDKPAWAKGDFWAPEIVADKGRFFVYYTARRDEGKGKRGTLCVAVAIAEKADGEWRDQGPLVCQEMGSLDPAFTRDENGQPFLIWKEDGNDRQKPTWLYAQGLDEKGTHLTGKPTKLFRNDAVWEKNVVEGAYILRRNGWFYLFYSGSACCGRSCDYALGVARSKTLLGKWEKNPANPILAANETWQCPGHGSLVSTPDGRDFLLYHAYRKGSEGFNIGREALLDEVKFENGWATINGASGPSKTAAAPFKLTKQQSIFSGLTDEFNESVLAPFWNQMIFNDHTTRLTEGFLVLAPTEKQLLNEKMPEIVVTERTVAGDYTATTRVDFEKIAADEFAGMSVYSWRDNAVGISLGNGKIFTWRREGGKQTDAGNITLPKNTTALQLRVRAAVGEVFDFAYSTDGKSWMQVGDKISFGNLEGARIALVYNGRTANAGVRFDWIRVEGK